MGSDTEIPLGRWDNFSGGHWGALGATRAEKGQWGGINMALTRRGCIAPVAAARRYTTDAVAGEVFGMRWAWGLDGRLYFVQDVAGTSYVKRFDPSDPTTSATVTTVGAIADCTVAPDWVIAGGALYLTIFGQATYVIDPTAVSVTALTGTAGAAPAGRAICVYGDQMLVGGISDARYSTFPSRIVYSGFADFTDWQDTAFFDVGGDGKQVRALVPMRDQLLIVLEDGQVWVLQGTPGVNERLRRYHGFDRAAGAISAVTAQHAAVDPSQNRAWVYDHAYRTVSRFNGVTLARVPNFGAPASTRTMANEDQGNLAVIGGPDDVFVARVALPRTDGEREPRWHSLMRLNGAWSAVDQDVITGGKG